MELVNFLTVLGTKVSGPKYEFDFYISTTGSDDTGDGSYKKPWYTFKNVPNNARIGLLPGVYSTKQYGILSSTYMNFHGLYTTPTTAQINKELNNTDRYVANGTLNNIIDEPDYIAKHGIKQGTTVGSAMGRGSVLIEYIHTGLTGRDCFLFAGNNVLFRDIDFYFDTTPKSRDHEVSLIRLSENFMLLNSNIEIVGRYAYNYQNGGTLRNAAIYKNVTFTGGTLMPNYSGTQIFID